jgi:hypothetical protein
VIPACRKCSCSFAHHADHPFTTDCLPRRPVRHRKCISPVSHDTGDTGPDHRHGRHTIYGAYTCPPLPVPAVLGNPTAAAETWPQSSLGYVCSSRRAQSSLYCSVAFSNFAKSNSRRVASSRSHCSLI